MAQAAQQPDWVEALLHGLQNRRRHIDSPTFDGTTDVRKFLQTFAEVAEGNNWEDNERTLRLKLALKGTASECAHGDTADEIAESLLNRFQLTREEARRELRNLKLRAGQDIHLFGNLVMKFVRMAEPDFDVEQLDERATAELVDAIGDKLLTREFRLQGPINFSDAIRRIQQYNSDMRVSKLNRFSVEDDEKEVAEMKDRINKVEREVQQLNVGFSKAQEENKVVFNELNKTLKELLARQNPNTPEMNAGRPPVTCYNCGRAGHVARQCRSAPRSNPNAAWGGRVTCYNCQQTGHVSRNCPMPRNTGQQQERPDQGQSLNTRGPQ